MDLKALIDTHIVFADTCSWLLPEAEPFFSTLLPEALKEKSRKIRISGKVLEEINKHKKSTDEELAKQANRVSGLLASYNKEKIIEVYQDPDDPFQDQAILAMFMKYRTKYALAMITQDRKFALDIENLNNQGSVQSSKTILVFYIDKFGALQRWDYGVKEHEKRQHTQHTQHSQSSAKESSATRDTARSAKDKQPVVGLPLGTHVEQGLDIELPVSVWPEEQHTITTDAYGPLTLEKKLGTGGEGSVYLTSNNLVCKVYTKMTRARYEKLKLMLQVPFDKQGICWPKSLAYNEKKECIGYIMEQASGKVMQLSMFHKKLLEKNFPHWNRASLVELALTILDKIKYLHERNIIIGDINPFNIMIKDSKEVYFVDTDSYQIVNYPCPVGTINFTPPETQGQRYHEYLRTFEHEYFAVATLIFMVLMPGKPPYAQQGGGTPGENIKNMEFPYPFDDYKGNAPDGVWRFIWSHYTYKLKGKFFQAFSENKRFSAEEWINELEQYLFAIKKGYSNDEIWPSSNKISENKAVEVKCNQCSQLFMMHEDKKQDLDMQGKFYICNSCLVINKVTRVQRNEQAAAAGSQPQGKSTSVRRVAQATSATRTANRASSQASATWSNRATGSGQGQSGSAPIVLFTPRPKGLIYQTLKFIITKVKK